jgi:hypothetical protein
MNKFPANSSTAASSVSVSAIFGMAASSVNHPERR